LEKMAETLTKEEQTFKNVTCLNHPVVAHKLTVLRDLNTPPKEFRRITGEIALFLAAEATKDLPTETKEIETPLTKTTQPVLKGKWPCFVPVLRAGLGFLEGFLNIIPDAVVGHLGLSRNDDLTTKEYYCKLPPDVTERPVYILDPMIGTGGTAITAVKLLRENGVKNIKLVGLLASADGLKKFISEVTDVPVLVAGIDPILNEKGYIVPGLGDAGDRTFGTVDH